MLFQFTSAAKILVIDDDSSLQRLVRAHLNLHTKFEVIQAIDGYSGLAHAQNDLPNLIVLDWMLPDIEGMEVLRKLKANRQTRDIPVLMITGRNKMGDIEGAFKLGAKDYLTKPFTMDILKKKMRVLVN